MKSKEDTSKSKTARVPKALPVSWPLVRFGDVVRDVKATVDRDTTELTRFVAGEHMDSDDIHLRRWGEVNGDYLGPAFHRGFRKGQVLYGSRRTYLKKVAVAPFDGICANTTFVLESKDPDILLPELLPFIMLTDAFTQHSIRESKGSVNPYINWRDIAKYEFPLPPKDEQRRIAEILWAADESNTLWNESQMKLVLAIERIKDEEFSPRESPCTPLRELCPKDGIQIGPFGSQLHVSDYTEKGVPVIMPVHLTDEKIVSNGINRVSESTADRLEKHKLRIGDIVLARRGDLSKRGFVTENEQGWLCGTGCIRVRVAPSIPSRAVFHSLSSRVTLSWINQNAVGTTMPNTNGDIVGRIPVKFPDPKRLPSVLRAIDELVCKLSMVNTHAVETSSLARTLAMKLLTGTT